MLNLVPAEGQDGANKSLIGEEHDQAIETEGHAGARWQTGAQSLQIELVQLDRRCPFGLPARAACFSVGRLKSVMAERAIDDNASAPAKRCHGERRSVTCPR